MSFRPMGDRILVEEDKREEVSQGGIILPEQVQEKPMLGTVRAVGKGRVMESGEVFPMEVRVGDRVMFGKYAGTDIKIDGVKLMILRESEILGIVE